MRAASRSDVLTVLAHARSVATYAEVLGITGVRSAAGVPRRHLGAVLADTILQAGLNYRTVVRSRVERVEHAFPKAATLSGIISVVEERGLSDFLLWSHPTKLTRFWSLVELLHDQSLESVDSVRVWLQSSSATSSLLAINGIGPKTVDYLGCLVGLDRIPVDRHLMAFVKDAGVDARDYDSVQAIMSFAADLLGFPRRDFDASIWKYVSEKRAHVSSGADAPFSVHDIVGVSRFSSLVPAPA